MLKIYLLTRGQEWDYSYLNVPPQERPWEGWPELFPEQESVFILSQEKHLSAFLTGISSQQCDNVKTPIRYSLAFDGVPDDKEKKVFLKILGQWFIEWEMKYQKESPTLVNKSLGVTLDKLFAEYMKIPFQREHKNEEVEENLNKFFNEFSESENDPFINQCSFNHWIGGIASKKCRQTFQKRVKNLLFKNKSGCAIYINGLESQDHVQKALLQNHKDCIRYNNLSILVNAPPNELMDPKKLELPEDTEKKTVIEFSRDWGKRALGKIENLIHNILSD